VPDSRARPIPNTTPGNPDQQRERSVYYKADEEALKATLFRIFGTDDQLPWKLPAEDRNSAGYQKRHAGIHGHCFPNVKMNLLLVEGAIPGPRRTPTNGPSPAVTSMPTMTL